MIGCLLGLRDDGRTALVSHAFQRDSAAVRAETTVDLAGAHVGKRVLLVFLEGDASRPVVVGVLRRDGDPPAAELPGSFELEADSERLVVSARKRLVLRCGEASVTLTDDGKVLIRGRHVVSEAAGTNRIRGGSVQLN